MAKDTRLQKMLAECGIASRRKAEEMIAAGRVAVNGVRAQIGDKVDVKKDKVTVDGQRVQTVDEKVYIMVHKPRGYLTSMSDDRGRKCVSELVEELPVRLFPIGRLDKDSEGLLLMTNDGDFANLIALPCVFWNSSPAAWCWNSCCMRAATVRSATCVKQWALKWPD